MDRPLRSAAGAVVLAILATGGAQAQQRVAILGPTPATQLGEAANAISAMSTVLIRGEPQRGGAGTIDIASRSPTLSMGGLFEGIAPADVSFSSQGMGDVEITPWAEFSGLQSDDRLRRYDALVLEFGADAALANGLTLGASVALVQSQTESLLDASDQSGDGQGYIVTLSALYEAGGWTADAALRFSHTEYDQVLLGTAGSAEGDGTALRVSVSRAFDLGNGGTLSPTAAIVTGRQEITGTGGGLAGAGTREVTFTETSLGAIYAHEFGAGTASFGLFADNLDVSGDAGTVLIGLDRAGASGRIELGYNTALSEAVDVSAGVSYGGLGSDMEVIQGALGLSFRF